MAEDPIPIRPPIHHRPPSLWQLALYKASSSSSAGGGNGSSYTSPLPNNLLLMLLKKKENNRMHTKLAGLAAVALSPVFTVGAALARRWAAGRFGTGR